MGSSDLTVIRVGLGSKNEGETSATGVGVFFQIIDFNPALGTVAKLEMESKAGGVQFTVNISNVFILQMKGTLTESLTELVGYSRQEVKKYDYSMGVEFENFILNITNSISFGKNTVTTLAGDDVNNYTTNQYGGGISYPF